MKVLVTVASKHGSTREIAGVLAEELRNSAIEADLKDVSDVTSVEGYDAMILGSAIYAGNWLPEARQFAEQHRAELSSLPVWLFSCGPLGGEEDPKPHDDPDKLVASMAGVEWREHKVFVGKLDHAELSLGETLLVKVVGAPSGDFRDWEEIRGWAQDIQMELHSLQMHWYDVAAER